MSYKHNSILHVLLRMSVFAKSEIHVSEGVVSPPQDPSDGWGASKPYSGNKLRSSDSRFRRHCNSDARQATPRKTHIANPDRPNLGPLGCPTGSGCGLVRCLTPISEMRARFGRPWKTRHEPDLGGLRASLKLGPGETARPRERPRLEE